jgi:hypothetical protein
MLFCGYCGSVKRSDNLEAHCQSVHNDCVWALRENEKPKAPCFVNWKEYIEQYPCHRGTMDIGAKIYKKRNVCGSLFPMMMPQHQPKESNRSEKKAKQALQRDIEKGTQVNLRDFSYRFTKINQKHGITQTDI